MFCDFLVVKLSHLDGADAGGVYLVVWFFVRGILVVLGGFLLFLLWFFLGRFFGFGWGLFVCGIFGGLGVFSGGRVSWMWFPIFVFIICRACCGVILFPCWCCFLRVLHSFVVGTLFFKIVSRISFFYLFLLVWVTGYLSGCGLDLYGCVSG